MKVSQGNPLKTAEKIRERRIVKSEREIEGVNLINVRYTYV
jgi:hypothetical protein